MKILWLTNIPSPYRLKFFSELGKHAELTVLFEKGFSAERDETWRDFRFENFTGVVLKGISVITDMALSFGFKKYIQQYKNDIIVVSNPITPTGISAILYMQLHKIRYCIESDGAFPKECQGFRGKLKRKLYSKAYLCLTTSELGKQYFVNYGVSKNKIEKYPFSSIYETEICQTCVTQAEKSSAKQFLGIRSPHMILSVGRYIPIKGFDNLIRAFNQVKTPCDLYIIGGQPNREYTELVNTYQENRVVFLDFMKPNELQKYYDAADVFAFTSHGDVWGLVVNEAMARGVPVVSTDHAIAGIEMVVEGKNGYIVEDNDIDGLQLKLEAVLAADEYDNMCDAAIKTAHEYSIEKMVIGHIDLFNRYY